MAGGHLGHRLVHRLLRLLQRALQLVAGDAPSTRSSSCRGRSSCRWRTRRACPVGLLHAAASRSEMYWADVPFGWPFLGQLVVDGDVGRERGRRGRGRARRPPRQELRMIRNSFEGPTGEDSTRAAGAWRVRRDGRGRWLGSVLRTATRRLCTPGLRRPSSRRNASTSTRPVDQELVDLAGVLGHEVGPVGRLAVDDRPRVQAAVRDQLLHERDARRAPQPVALAVARRLRDLAVVEPVQQGLLADLRAGVRPRGSSSTSLLRLCRPVRGASTTRGDFPRGVSESPAAGTMRNRSVPPSFHSVEPGRLPCGDARRTVREPRRFRTCGRSTGPPIA